jgi:hypothetical protein
LASKYFQNLNQQQATQRIFSEKDFFKRHALSALKRKVLLGIDLLVIDEVSMCRADIIDAIDHRLRQVRRRSQPFGGVQVLMIGDLHQLPPIVKDEEWTYLSQCYQSPYFYEALVLKEGGMVQIELDHVFRQKDQLFVDLLNRMRKGRSSQDDLELLNQQVNPTYQAGPGEITLVTHNSQASRINGEELNKLDAEVYTYQAKIEGDFPEHNYPLSENLQLKEGAQVMFVKNDPDGNYFNGKIVEVLSLDEDSITVMDQEGKEIAVQKEEWLNVRYVLNDKKQEIEEERLGSFTQYPLKLAWAVTVHKSQGLTFERAVLDLGRAFAPGQAYVALSRLKSLEGAVLRSALSERSVFADPAIIEFSRSEESWDRLKERLSIQRKQFLEQFLLEAFDFRAFHSAWQFFKQKHYQKFQSFEDERFMDWLLGLESTLQKERKHSEKFSEQLRSLLYYDKKERLLDRLDKASTYYIKVWRTWLAKIIKLMVFLESLKGNKALGNELQELLTQAYQLYEKVSVAQQVAEQLLAGEALNLSGKKQEAKREQLQQWRLAAQEALKQTRIKSSGKMGRKRAVKGASKKETWQLAQQGLSPEEIAQQRNLKLSTIFGHLAEGVKAESLSWKLCFSEEEQEALKAIRKANPKAGLIDLAKKDKAYNIDQWRVALAQIDFLDQ